MTNYTISITSDVVCPWCYLGHARLSRAIAAHKTTYPDDTFKLTYLPYYLNPPPQLKSSSVPPFPVKSKPRRQAYEEKFGAARAAMIERNMKAVSAGEGFDFKFGGMTGPSRNGHRLVAYAQHRGGEESQNRVMLGLWKRYFEQEVDITTLEVLVETGVEAGLGSADEIKEYLESGEGGKEVDELAERARVDDGVMGVPHYTLVESGWDVSGAQEPEAFLRLFKRWKEKEAKGEVGKANGCL